MSSRPDIYTPVKHKHIFGEFADIAVRTGDIMALGGMIADGRYIGSADALEIEAERVIVEIEQLCATVRAQENQGVIFQLAERKRGVA